MGRAGTRVRLARAFSHAAGIRATEVGSRIHRRVSQGVGGRAVSRHVRDGRRGGRALGPYPARAPPQRTGPRPVGAAGRLREPGRAARRGVHPRAARGNRPQAAGTRAARLDQGSPGVRSPDAFAARPHDHACVPVQLPDRRVAAREGQRRRRQGALGPAQRIRADAQRDVRGSLRHRVSLPGEAVTR
ncbi:hypothetical protein F01_460520 [Burkholderia cenocepacia]|nr:hypothetical protein F01_460520 [Burkholderia cenocepacia]